MPLRAVPYDPFDPFQVGTPAPTDTPLHDAVRRHDVTQALRLLHEGADPNAPNEDGQTPWSLALRGDPRDPERVRLWRGLLSAGADVARPTPRWPTWIIVRGAPLDVVPDLVQAGLDLNRPDADGATPLLRAVEDGPLDVDLLHALIAAGANVTLANSLGNTALHLLLARALTFPWPLVEALLAAGAAWTASNGLGETPATLAATRFAVTMNDPATTTRIERHVLMSVPVSPPPNPDVLRPRL